ncbi:MAG: filamentous hemagglutinin N-terminal domain-containing protein, partial [Stellaceae bacterium]
MKTKTKISARVDRARPLVSCIMPTANRRRFVPEAIRLFLEQDYPTKELVVIDDGEDCVADLIPKHRQVRYLRLGQRQSVGVKRNLACTAAHGDLIAHWDDDDWYAPWRLSRQVAEILNGKSDFCGLARMLFFDPAAQRAWEYVYPAGAAPWVYGATFCYRKSIWQQSPFPDVTGIEDNLFIANLAPGVRLRAVPETRMFVGLVHGANSSPKRTDDPLWRPRPIRRIRRVVGSNWAQAPSPAAGAGVCSASASSLSVSLGAATVVAGALYVAVAPASANPKGGQVVAGTATVSNPSSTQLQITQTTNRAAIDWQSFDIAPGERTSFVQPSAESWALNRVKSADPSVIAGSMTANGSLVLINPNGIVFSKGSQVDVHSLIATPSDISNANFMAGRMKFDKPPSNPAATVVNKGTITVAQRGLAALVAPGVENAGLIEAKLAKVTLAGAETFAIDLYGDGLISFDVSSLVTTTPIGPGGKPLAALVSNSGRINAPGGTVLLTADAVAGIVENIVDVPGTIMARTVGDVPGSVMIDAGPTGTANLAGKISVSGLRQGQVGGSATITGNAVNLASTARIKARGDAAGGIVRIGGGPHGQDPILRNAQRTTVATGAVIDASATGVGDGGQVTVWSDQGTEFGGTIKARGGPRGGNGGRIETSGKLDLSVLPSAQVDAAAPMGKAGNWLLDPGNLTVANSNSNITPANGSGATVTPGPPVPDNATVDAAVVSGTLNGGTNVTLSTVGAPGTLNGDITVNAISSPPTLSSISWSTAAQLTLNAAGNISILSPISGTNGALALLAGGTISQTAAGIITVANLNARTQNDAGSAITLTNPANAVSGDVTLSALNSAGTAPAPGPISFVDSTGFTVAAQPGNGLNGQEIGINTTGTISLQGGSTIQINGAVGNPAAGSVS